MANRFLHIGINFHTPNDLPRIHRLAGVLDIVAPDWLRYAPNNWIVYTDKTAQQMADFLRPYLPTDDFLVLPINIQENRQGWMPSMAWEWLNKPRSEGWTPPTAYSRSILDVPLPPLPPPRKKP